MKRSIDIVLSLLGLILSSVVLLFFMCLIWLEDKHSPLYLADRAGLYGATFKMIKLRSLAKDADKTGPTSTSSDDIRMTHIGKLIRRFKIDELTQLYNVFVGDMSLVGPRPQVQSAVDLYNPIERDLLNVRPGITDFASIVFSNEAEVLAGHRDVDSAYNELIRPGKSTLGLFYVNKHSTYVDLSLIILTLIAIFSRKRALSGVRFLLKHLGAPKELINLAIEDCSLEN